MIKDNQKSINRAYVLIDMLIIAGSYVLAYYLRFHVLVKNHLFELPEGASYYTLPVYSRYLVLVLPMFLIIYAILGLYKPKRSITRRKEFYSLIAANVIGIMVLMSFFFLIKDFDMPRAALAVFVLLNSVVESAYRMALLTILHVIRKNNINQKHVLIVGYSRAAERYIDRVSQNLQWGYQIHGILDDTMTLGTVYKKVSVVGDIGCLESMLDENDFDEIIIAFSINEYGKLEKVVGICEKSGIHTKFIPDYNNIIPTIPHIEDMYGLPVINIRKVPLNNPLNKFLKRAVDIVGSILAIVVFLIPMIIVAIAIKISSHGPVIYSQIRVGLHNKKFKMYKFRSMEVREESDEDEELTTYNDTRVTKVGKHIRKTSIDELLQLFNVLIGNMSLVGPRPVVPNQVERFKEEIPRYMIKHQVRPGMTGLAQINGYRGDTSIRRRIEHDLYYIENWTLGLDIKILFLTIFKGFVNKNAF